MLWTQFQVSVDFHLAFACFEGSWLFIINEFFRGNTFQNKRKNCDNYYATKHFVFKIVNICRVDIYTGSENVAFK